MSDLLNDEEFVLIIKPDGTFEKVKGKTINFDSNDIKSIINFENGVKIEHYKRDDVFIEDAKYEDMAITFTAKELIDKWNDLDNDSWSNIKIDDLKI